MSDLIAEHIYRLFGPRIAAALGVFHVVYRSYGRAGIVAGLDDRYISGEGVGIAFSEARATKLAHARYHEDEPFVPVLDVYEVNGVQRYE